MTPPLATGQRLDALLAERAGELRDPDLVLAPAHLGAARLTRHSFNRALLRRASQNAWQATRGEFEMDDVGRGHAVYRINAEGYEFNFVAFTTTIDESLHTDRVIAGGWEITGALIEGPVTADLFDHLKAAVPLQEAGRLDARVLVLTRGNRSVRFYDYLVDRLAAGLQPEGTKVADAGYIMRSTAFYGNGKFGMRSFLGYPAGHPLGVPYRAQFLAAWMFRELSYDSVEHCARAKGGDSAVGFDDEWDRYFGLGNATGLGLVPYAFKHPRVLNAWAGVRELSLANVRRLANTPELRDALRWWIDRAHRHFADDGGGDRAPWFGPATLARIAENVKDKLTRFADEPLPFDALYRWAEDQDVETCELVVALLVELDSELTDDEADELLAVDESVDINPLMTADELSTLVDNRYAWIDDLDLESGPGDHYWWVVSDNTEEPRRAPRQIIDPKHREVRIDIANQVASLRQLLGELPSDLSIGELGVCYPQHKSAIKRVIGNEQPYGEPRDNALHIDYLPLELQRFQLAMYGMDNFSPKSTDWLRVTLFQGAPRIEQLDGDYRDNWVLPPRPTGATS